MSRRPPHRPDPRRRARDDDPSREQQRGAVIVWERNGADHFAGCDRLLVDGQIVGHVLGARAEDTLNSFSPSFWEATIFPTNTVTEITRREFSTWDDARLACEAAASAALRLAPYHPSTLNSQPSTAAHGRAAS